MRCTVLHLLLLLAVAAPAQVLVDLRVAGSGPAGSVPASKSPLLPPKVMVRNVRMELTDVLAHTMCELRLGNPNGTDLAGRLLVPLPPRVIPGSVKITLAGTELGASTLQIDAARRALRDAVRSGSPAVMLSGAGAPHLVAEVPLVAAAAETVLRIEHDADMAGEDGSARYELHFTNGLQPEFCQARVTSRNPIGVLHAGGEDVTLTRTSPHAAELKWIRPVSYPRVAFTPVADGFSYQFSAAEDVDGSRTFALYITAPEESPAEPAGQDIIFTMDVSGSMRGEHALLARELCRRTAEKLGARDRAGLVRFSGDAAVVHPLASADAAGIAAMKLALETLPAAGGTNLVAGLGAAFRLPDPARRAQIVLFTDGAPTVGATSARSVLGHVRSANKDRVPVHVITLGADDEAPVLDLLAESSGGARLRVASLSDVAVSVARLQRDLGPELMFIESITVEGAGLSELALPQRRGVPAGGRTLVTGRITSATAATLKAELNLPGVRRTLSIPVPQRVTVDAHWVTGLHGVRWLGQQLTHWREAGEPETGRREIEAWGRRFGVPTPFGALVFGTASRPPLQQPGRAGGEEPKRAVEAHSLLALSEMSTAGVPLQPEIQRVGGRVLMRDASGWSETHLAAVPLPSDGQRIIRIVEGSDAWCAMLDAQPELAAVFALEAPILFESNGQLVQIVAR